MVVNNLLECSKITGKTYDTDDVLYIVNPLQTYKYIKHGAELLDIELGSNDKLLYVFNRANTKELYDAWCLHELR